MPDKAFSQIATDTSDTLEISGPAAGLQWIIWQLSVQTIPYRPGAVAVVKRNGTLITSTVNGGRAAAQGPPALMFNPGDYFTVDWTGIVVGDQLICTLMYEEVQYGQPSSGFGLI